MSRVIVIEFVTLDGVTQDPDGNEGFGPGGWAFRFGPEAVTGDPSAWANCWTPARCCWAAAPGRCSPGSGRDATMTSLPR
jgi:hypothetical protein